MQEETSVLYDQEVPPTIGERTVRSLLTGYTLVWGHVHEKRVVTAMPSEGTKKVVIKDVARSELLLDVSNPRLVEHGLSGSESQEEVLALLWKEMAVEEIAMSIAANGFFQHEPLIVMLDDDSRSIVIEGNRRLAAARLLTDAKARTAVGATDLPKAPKWVLEQLVTIPVTYTDRAASWPHIGFKHVNGPLTWSSISKAHYIARVHNTYDVPLPQIATQIGDGHATVRRLYRGLMVLDQARQVGAYDPEDRYRRKLYFSHLYTGLDYPGIQKFLGLSSDEGFKPNPIAKKRLENLGCVLTWMFGLRSKSLEPLIKSQNPDLRIMDEVLQTKPGTEALMQGLPLGTSLDIAKGDERLFREYLQSAKIALQNARGTQIHGFTGESKVLRLGSEVRDLANAIHGDMKSAVEGE